MTDDRSRSPRAAYRGETILGRGRALPTDSWATGLNNNLLVIGPSGSGKTRCVLKPNLLQPGPSLIVLDSKGLLFDEVGPFLARNGYRVQRIDFANLPTRRRRGRERDVGYNPLAQIRRGSGGRPNQQDIISVSKALCPVESFKDPFWDNAAANYLACLIAYALEQLPRDEGHLGSVIRLVEGMQDGTTGALLEELEELDPASYALQLWRRSRVTEDADKMHASILGILAEKVACLGFEGALRLYTEPRQVDFARMGHERTALFVTMSDLDHSLAPLTSLFVIQAFAALSREADRCAGGALPVPVRLMLDDFANLRIPDMDDMLSVARSREIWCTLLLQSETQLEARYGRAAAMSIIGNCDAQLVLAFQDADTARAFQDRANKTPGTLMAAPLDRAWLFVRGRAPEQVERFELEEHPRYAEMARSRWGREAGRGLEAPGCRRREGRRPQQAEP